MIEKDNKPAEARLKYGDIVEVTMSPQNAAASAGENGYRAFGNTNVKVGQRYKVVKDECFGGRGYDFWYVRLGDINTGRDIDLYPTIAMRKVSG